MKNTKQDCSKSSMVHPQKNQYRTIFFKPVPPIFRYSYSDITSFSSNKDIALFDRELYGSCKSNKNYMAYVDRKRCYTSFFESASQSLDKVTLFLFLYSTRIHRQTPSFQYVLISMKKRNSRLQLKISSPTWGY